MKRLLCGLFFMLLFISSHTVMSANYYIDYERERKVEHEVYKDLGASAWMRTFDLRDRIGVVYEYSKENSQRALERTAELNDSLYNRQQEIETLKIWNIILTIGIVLMIIVYVDREYNRKE